MFNNNLFNNDFFTYMDTFVLLTTTISLAFTLTITNAYATTNDATNDEKSSYSTATSALLRRMDRVLVVAVGSVIEIVSVTIVVDHEVNGRIVTSCVVVVGWSIVNIQLGVGLSV